MWRRYRKRQLEKQQLKQEIKEYKGTHRLLLLGPTGSGKSAIVKLFRCMTKGLEDDERRRAISDIHDNVNESITALINAVRRSSSLRLATESIERCADRILAAEKPFTPDFFTWVSDVWRDPAIQEINVDQESESQFAYTGRHLLDQVGVISRPDYLPGMDDWSLSRVPTHELEETRFTYRSIPFHLVDVSNQDSERLKWTKCFTEITAIFFVVDCSSYDVKSEKDASKNRLQEALDLFERISNDPFLRKYSVILFLNKQDLLWKKVLLGRSPLENYFPDFAGYRVHGRKQFEGVPPEVLRAQLFIRDKFTTIAQRYGHDSRDVYPHLTMAMDTENLRAIFNDCSDIIQEEYLRLHARILKL